MMVAIGLLSVLGLMLISSLRESASIVARGTSKGEAYLEAQALLSRVEQDVLQVYRGPGKRLISGQDPLGRQFLAFVRALPEESYFYGGYYSGAVLHGGDPTVQESHTLPIHPKSDWKHWRNDDSNGALRPLGGLAEVCFMMDPSGDGGRDRLLRGIMAPIYFPPVSERVLELENDRERRPWGWSPGPIDDMQRWFTNGGDDESASRFAESNFSEPYYQLLSDKTLYLGFEFADPLTTTGWSEGSNGPLYYWESATEEEVDRYSLGDLKSNPKWPFRNDRNESEDAFIRDMGFPSAIRVVVTVAVNPPLQNRTRLTGPIDAETTMIYVESNEGFPRPRTDQSYIKVGSEWMYVTAVGGNTFSVQRGARGTRPKDHPSFTEVKGGISFYRVISLPTGK